MSKSENDEAWLDDYDEFDENMWKPRELFGWTWVKTGSGAPECYSLFDADGELMGCVYNRYGRVICWAPFTWAEEAYRSTDDIGEYGFENHAQRMRHFARIGPALTQWVRRKREAGVDIALLRDTHAYYFETGNGHYPKTISEQNYRGPFYEAEMEAYDTRLSGDPAAVSFNVDGWQADLAEWWHCEGYRIRDETGQLRGNLQVRLGVVRAVAAQPEDANKVDPLLNDSLQSRDKSTCRGQIVIQERLRPLALSFNEDERDDWLRRGVEAIRATPNPDRMWPPETLGAKGTLGQQMFPASPRDWV